MLKLMKELSKSKSWPSYTPNAAKPKFADEASKNEVYITYINHACHLIQTRNLNILTDPLFSKRAGPMSIMGPKRKRDPGIHLKQLPRIDVIVISHNHYDHMDLPSLRKIEKRFHPIFIVPLGNHKHLAKMKQVVELDWWEKHKINETQSISLVPAQHWSSRKFGDINKALWGGFWMESGDVKIFFAGDTGYGDHFKVIKNKLGSPTISILPIGAYEPRWFMKNSHMNPEEAVLASLDLGSKLNIASHYLTLQLSLEGVHGPAIDLRESMKKHDLKEEEFLLPENGETVIYIPPK